MHFRGIVAQTHPGNIPGASMVHNLSAEVKTEETETCNCPCNSRSLELCGFSRHVHGKEKQSYWRLWCSRCPEHQLTAIYDASASIAIVCFHRKVKMPNNRFSKNKISNQFHTNKYLYSMKRNGRVINIHTEDANIYGGLWAAGKRLVSILKK